MWWGGIGHKKGGVADGGDRWWVTNKGKISPAQIISLLHPLAARWRGIPYQLLPVVCYV